MIWSVLQVASKQSLALLVFSILTWLLSPYEFGVLATAMIVISFLDSFSESGFGSALIQKQNITPKHITSIFVFNICIGVVLTIIGILAAGVVANYFDLSILRPVLMVLSLGFVINAASLTQLALAQKNLRFRSLTIRDSIATVIGGACGIILALYHAGVWSLVAQTIVTYTISTIVIWRMSQWRPHWRDLSMDALKELWPYSSKLFIYNFIKFFAQNVEKIVISVMLGSLALGIYTFAVKLTVLPITMFAGAIGIYLFPQLARLQDNQQQAVTSYLRTTQVVQTVVTPIIIGTVVSAPLLVPLIWQDKWLAAISLMQILGVLAYIQNLISPMGQLLKAFNRPGLLLVWSIIVTVGLMSVLPLLARYDSLFIISLGFTAVYAIGIPVNYFFVKQVLPITVSTMSRAILPSLLNSGLAAMMFSVCVLLLKGHPWLQLITGVSLAATMYCATTYWFDRSSWLIIMAESQRLWRAATSSLRHNSLPTQQPK